MIAFFIYKLNFWCSPFLVESAHELYKNAGFEMKSES